MNTVLRYVPRTLFARSHYMSYLHSFLNILSPAERSTLSDKLHLSGTEQKVLSAHLRAVEKKREVQDMPKHLGMSISHVDKCVSLILARCYEYVERTQGETIFHILAKGGLHENYVHELTKRDRTLSKAQKPAELEDLYHTAVNSYLLFEARLFREKQWEQIGKRYCAVAKNPEAPTIVRIRSLIRIIIVHFIKGERDEVMREHERDLLQIWADIRRRKWPESHIVLGRALAQLYTATQEWQKVVQWWEMVLGVLEKNPDIYRDAKYVVRGSLADAYLRLEGAEKARAHCDAVWEENADIYRRNGQLNLIYFRILLICRDFPQAKQVLMLRFGTMDVPGTGLMRPMDSVDFSLYYLYVENFDAAKKFISEGLSLSVKLYRGVEAELRFLECAAFFLSGDSFYALELIARALRYFATKKEIRDSIAWREEFRLLRALIQAHEKHATVKANVSAYYTGLNPHSLDIFSNAQNLCWEHYRRSS